MSARTQAVVLATTHHDPDGRLREQTQRILLSLLELFDQIVVLATSTTQPQSVELLQAHGALVSYEEKNQAIGLNGLGKARRGILELALQQQAELHFIAAPAALRENRAGLHEHAVRQPVRVVVHAIDAADLRRIAGPQTPAGNHIH